MKKKFNLVKKLKNFYAASSLRKRKIDAASGSQLKYNTIKKY
jgi:hypothetical protein